MERAEAREKLGAGECLEQELGSTNTSLVCFGQVDCSITGDTLLSLGNRASLYFPVMVMQGAYASSIATGLTVAWNCH